MIVSLEICSELKGVRVKNVVSRLFKFLLPKVDLAVKECVSSPD